MSGLPLKLPRGFRFSPTDVELIDYLRSKISGDDEEVDFIPEILFYKSEPWELPGKSSIPTMDPQWFFFSQPEMKYRRGNQSKRSTEKGFWKPTGNDRKIMSGSSLIGMKRTLVFYEGRARKCTKTSWVTHEYRTEPYQNSFLLCRVFDKRKGPNGAGPSVQSPTTSKSHLDETNSEIALGSVSPSSEVKVPDFGTRTINDGFHAENSDAAISDATTAVENQSAQDTFAEDEQLRPSEEDFEFLAACMQEPVDATELKEGMNREKVSPAFPEVSPVTDGGVVLKNGMNENAAYSLEDFISLDDLDDNFGNESGGQKNLASGFETPMNIVFSEDNGSFSGSNAEHGRVPWQYWANNPAAYFPECWESVFYNQDNISPQ